MKKLIHIYIFGFSLLPFGCEQHESSNTPAESPLEIQQKTEKYNFENASSTLRNIVLTDTAIIRGLNWASDIDDINAVEDTKTLVEQGEDYYDFLVNIATNEQADVIYYVSAGGLIEKIEIDVYSANLESRKNLYTELIQFFQSKYGLPSSEIEEVKIWKHQASKTYIEMRMLGNSKINDLQIDIKNLEISENF